MMKKLTGVFVFFLLFVHVAFADSLDVGVDLGPLDVGADLGSLDVGVDLGSLDVGVDLGGLDVGADLGSLDVDLGGAIDTSVSTGDAVGTGEVVDVIIIPDLDIAIGDIPLDPLDSPAGPIIDLPAQWNALGRVEIPVNAPNNTVVYPNLVQQCVDPDSAEIVSVVSSHQQFELFLDWNDLKIRNLENGYTGGQTVMVDCNGVRATFSLVVGANTAPVADAGPDRTVSINDDIEFDGSGSTDSDGSIVQYLWDFGDGVTAIGRVVRHAFSQIGHYIVTLTVTDNDGADHSDTALVRANGVPTAVLSCPVTARVHQQIVFDGSDSSDDTVLVTYSFDFGDGTVIDGGHNRETHHYVDERTYTVTLTVTDDDGLTSSASCSVEIVGSTPVFHDDDDEEDEDSIRFSRVQYDELVQHGEVLEVLLSLGNEGEGRIDDVTISVGLPELDVYSTIGPFDLFDDSRKRLYLDIPSYARGSYDLEIVVSNDDMHRTTYMLVTIV